MASPTEDLDSWRRVDPSLMVKKLRKEVPRQPGSRWVIYKNISPLDLYAYLKARFGEPNGFQMTLKTPSSDNYVHWHWTLQCYDQIIEFMGFNLHAEAYIEGLPEPSEGEQDSFVLRIKTDFAKHGPAISATKKSLEKWVVFVNPYHRLKRVVDQFSSRLRSLDIANVSLPGLPLTISELQEMKERWEACQTAYTEALGLGAALRMIAPVLAESFVNLLIFLLAKPELKQDERLYNDIVRREIDIRVKSLHLNCMGFKSPIDASATPFKDFHTLMNGRNDFLHGNIDPRRLKYDVVYFDGIIPLFDRYKNMSELALVNSLIHVEPNRALGDVEAVDRFVEFVLDHLHADVKRTVEIFMHTADPGWREDTKRVGILFSPHIVHGVPGPSTATDATFVEHGN